jgi:Kef-type K+ transport system membrane component KefB/Trk K+ transport system NAD-binding subunit
VIDAFLFQLVLVLLSAWAAGNLISRLGYPAVLGEIGVGILLGPPLLGLLRPVDGLQVVAELGVVLMMLYIGLEIDPRDVGRASRVGLLAAIGGFVVPFAMGYGAVILMGGNVWEAVFVAMATGVTSLATKSRILLDLRVLDTRIAHVMMAGALLADTLSLIVFAGLFGVWTAGSLELATLAPVVGGIAAFIVVAWVVGAHGLPRLYRLLERRGLTGRTFHLTLALVVGLSFAEGAELAGLHGILGAFVAGMFLRESYRARRLSHRVTEAIGDVSVGFLAPVFFVTAGFSVTFTVFSEQLALLLVIVAVATVGKILGTVLFYLPSGYGWREGLVVGFGMNGRGAVEIIIAGIGLELGIIGPEIFSILVFMAIVTTASVPVLLKWGVGWLERRDELVRADDSSKPVLVVGGGALARRIARQLAAGRPVRLLDLNANNVAAARADGLDIVQGDALDAATLQAVGTEECGTVLAITPNPAVNALVAQRARQDFLVPKVRAMLKPDSDAGLFDVLAAHGAAPLCGAPFDFARWEAVAQRPATVLVELTAAEARERLGDVDPDVGARDLLPVLVRRGLVVHLFSEVENLQEGDRVLAIRDA